MVTMKQGTPELRAFGLVVIDEHGQQDTAEEGGKGGKERPRPCVQVNTLAEGSSRRSRSYRRRQTAAEEVGQAHPGEQGVRGHMAAGHSS